jgi:hypothetical protein
VAALEPAPIPGEAYVPVFWMFIWIGGLIAVAATVVLDAVLLLVAWVAWSSRRPATICVALATIIAVIDSLGLGITLLMLLWFGVEAAEPFLGSMLAFVAGALVVSCGTTLLLRHKNASLQTR